jgi:hypothetical protein
MVETIMSIVRGEDERGNDGYLVTVGDKTVFISDFRYSGRSLEVAVDMFKAFCNQQDIYYSPIQGIEYDF